VATLVVIASEAPQIGRAFRLPLRGVIVGRGKACEVHAESGSSSRQPPDYRVFDLARVYFNVDSWVIEDLQFTNGCCVNDRPVVKSVLRDQDTLRIGSVIFKFSAVDASEIPRGTDEGEGGGGAPALLDTPKVRLRN
jgi:FHA domain